MLQELRKEGCSLGGTGVGLGWRNIIKNVDFLI